MKQTPTTRCALSLWALVLFHGVASADFEIQQGTVIRFATTQAAAEALCQPDDFVRAMSPLDRCLRIRTTEAVSADDYLAHVKRNLLEWNEDEKQKLTAIMQAVKPKLSRFDLPLPSEILLVKTSGLEEGAAAYTRGNAIVLPTMILRSPSQSLKGTFCHELFHVLSRHNPELRNRLYESIGFRHCGEVEYPETIRSRKLTNPDAPNNDYCIRVQIDDRPQWVTPLLFANRDTYDPQTGGQIFAYLRFEFLVVPGPVVPEPAVAEPAAQDAKLVPVGQIQGFYEQIGRNTNYIIHPEEILADNFALLVLQQRQPATPRVTQRIAEILGEE